MQDEIEKNQSKKIKKNSNQKNEDRILYKN